MWIDSARIVDVSHWQAEEDRTHHKLMDWQAAARANLVGVIPKYSQGISGIDPAAFLHAYNANAAGIEFLGGYHFGDASDPEKQAAHFLDAMKQDYDGDLTSRLLMLDAERNPSQMSVRQAEIFVSYVHDAIGRWPWLYMGRFGPTGDGKGLPSTILSRCRLILPAYGNHPNLTPILPAGWRVPHSPADRGDDRMGVCFGTQFTDGRVNGGPFPGLGVVDQSRFVGIRSREDAEAIWAS